MLQKRALRNAAQPSCAARLAMRFGSPSSLSKGQRGMSTALLGNEWRSALAARMSSAKAESEDTTHLYRKTVDGLGELVISAATPLTLARPGNGGMRLMQYPNAEAAETEAMGLAVGMEIKHATYNTGFAGAKMVCNSDIALGAWTPKDKKALMDAAAAMLKEHQGAMYTGCDMNTSTDDMDYLAAQGGYVLAAIGNTAVCPNTATAFGVLGAVEASVGGDVKGKTFVVHGCGNVGAPVAAELVKLGAAKVMTFDLDGKRADIAGCVNVSEEDPFGLPCDAMVPCSASGIITEAAATSLNCSQLVGATNLPFKTLKAREIAEAKGIAFVPEGISSAGAVVADSIEHYAADAFKEADPQDVYDFTRAVISEKTSRLLDSARRLRVPPSLVVPLVAECADSTYIGARFPDWVETTTRTKAFDDLKTKYADFSLAPNGTMFNGGISNQRAARGFNSSPASSSPKGQKRDLSSGITGGLRRAAPRGTRSMSSGPLSKADVVVVGGGVMGLNIAYQLRRRDANLKVQVLERAPALGFGSSGYSTGFQRAYYSFDETMSFALDGMEAYKNWHDYTQDKEASAYFTETGALWMLGYDKPQNAAMVDRLAKFGVSADIIDEQELTKRFPVMSAEPFPTFNEEGDEVQVDHNDFSAVFEHGCGHIDSSTCLEDLLRVCRRDGAHVQMNARVASFNQDHSTGRCTGVTMEDGSIIEAGVAVVNASGPWFNKLNDTVGLKLSTEALPTRIQVGHKWVPDEYCNLPFVADGWGPSGIYFMPRRANNQLVFGSVAHRFESEIVDPDDYNHSLDPDVKQDYLNCLFHRLPNLPRDGEIVGFSSMYTVNQDDVHPMIGETKVGGLWACNGFSGHGFKLAPAVGSLVAQQITGQRTDRWETNVPHDFMGPYREALTLKVKTHFA